MKNKTLLLGITLVIASILAVSSFAAKGGKFSGCTTIQDGTLLDSQGDPLVLGFNEWGYNYQAHLFNGKYCDAYFDAAWCQPWADVDLMMKWNDAWLSNKDCDGDGKLDRHYGFDSYIGSGAWLTNHQKGTYEQDGKTCNWEYFVKIVAKPRVDTECNEIWGSFCIIESVYNDPCAGAYGIEFLEQPAGFGAWR